jgi:hypothetical protein
MRLLKWNRPTWRLSTAQEFQFWLAWSTVLWWWALAEERQREEGIAFDLQAAKALLAALA